MTGSPIQGVLSQILRGLSGTFPETPKYLRTSQACRPYFRKILLVSVKFFVCNSGAGNGCANFLMDACKKSVRSAGKAMSIKFLVLGGGGYFGFWGGGSADFIFMGARIFLTIPVAP